MSGGEISVEECKGAHMKTIGLIGGMSWESSREYYRIINEKTREFLGNSSSAKIIMVSLNFAEIEELQHAGDWASLAAILIDAAKTLEQAKSDMVLICTNTMHKLAGEVAGSISIPLIHIADETGKEIQKRGLKKAALLGTKFTMEEDFYRKRLTDGFGLNITIPEEDDRKYVHKVIYNELIDGKIVRESRDRFISIIDGLAALGAEAVILGCTEIPLLIKGEDVSVPVFDTTRIHAEAAVREALRGSD